MKQQIFNHIKNIPGWRTNRKIVVISVDDYGNVRLDSKEARKNLDRAGIKVRTRFDALDTLETVQDLEELFTVLSGVKDKNNRHAIFTPFAIPCNINFEAMEEENYERYIYELLPETYEKLANKEPRAYSGAWKLWQEGIKDGLMKPQFHGREHLNLKVFEEKIKSRDVEVLTALKNRSYTSISSSGYPTIGYSAAFEFWEFRENDRFPEIISDGLRAFKEVYGYSSTHFNPPGGREHPVIHKALKANGIKYSDTPFLKQEHRGHGKYKRILNYTGKRSNENLIYQVRNVVFEPANSPNNDSVDLALKQVETAFRWHRPAIISSHRINFCGHIDPNNRRSGLQNLNDLLKKITQKWPDVEFMAADELGDLISKREE